MIHILSLFYPFCDLLVTLPVPSIVLSLRIHVIVLHNWVVHNAVTSNRRGIVARPVIQATSTRIQAFLTLTSPNIIKKNTLNNMWRLALAP